MTLAEQIVARLLENDEITPAGIYLSAITRNLVISEHPIGMDNREVYPVALKVEGEERLIPIGTLYKDKNWDQGWSAYEVYSKRQRDPYAGRYYVLGDWRSTPQEAAAILLAKWKRT